MDLFNRKALQEERAKLEALRRERGLMAVRVVKLTLAEVDQALAEAGMASARRRRVVAAVEERLLGMAQRQQAAKAEGVDHEAARAEG